MKFVTLPTQNWRTDADVCPNAYRIHRYDCPLMTDDLNKPEDRSYYDHPSVGKDSVEGAMTDAFFDAHDRYPYTLMTYGFAPLVTVCECCGGHETKDRVLDEADWTPSVQWPAE